MTRLLTINNCIEEPSNECCTGCGACLAACKFNAIHMGQDKFGFVIPYVDKELCRNCGICRTICYKFSNSNEGLELRTGKVLAAYSNSIEVKSKSSSGGVAYEISAWAINHGYEVWGVAYDYERNRAYHTCVHKIEELQIFQGSKYIQSDTSELMKAIQDGKVQDKAVIFGAPCQIYSLKKLKGDKDWILIDIFCSGVPTYLVWDKYLKYISRKHHISKITDIRNKKYPWHDCYISINDIDGHEYTNPAGQDLFYSFFLSKKIFRDSCFDCKFKLGMTCADLRIGDFWGHRYNDNDVGVSLVVLNNKTGSEIIRSLVNEKIISTEEANFDEVLEAQQAINKSRTPDVDSIRQMLMEKSINQVYWKYLAKPYYRTIARKLYYSVPGRIAKKTYHLLPDPAYKFLRKLRGYK